LRITDGVGAALPEFFQPRPEQRDFRIALDYFETGVNKDDAVKNGLQLGRLVHHVHGGRDLAAVVKQSRDLELVAVVLRHGEIPERADLAAVDRIGKQHGEHRHALAMSAGVRRLVVDRGVHQADEGFEQIFQVVDQQAVGERDRRLGCERFSQVLVGVGECDHFAAPRVLGIDQLQHADDLPFMILHRHGEERPGAIAGLLVKILCTCEVEALLGVGVGDVDRPVMVHRVGGHHGVDRLAGLVEEIDRVERNLDAGGAPHRDAERVVADDLEL
jgi:hypothetical protein